MDCLAIALYYYGLGYPPDVVRNAFSEAASARLKVFELRGTEDPFSVSILTVDPTKSEDDPAFVVADRQRYAPGAKDYSPTNSKDCFEGICMALVAGDYAIAEKLADHMWDPPNATYIGVHSEVCTPNQQHLAYAVRHLLQDRPDEVRKELKRVRCRKKEDQVAIMATMVGGLSEKNEVLFLDGLQELLCWHREQVKHPSNKNEPEMYLCIPGLALCVLAGRRGLKAELPDDPYLPLELIPENATSP